MITHALNRKPSKPRQSAVGRFAHAWLILLLTVGLGPATATANSSSTLTQQYGYDDEHRLTQRGTGSNAIAYQYDLLNRLTALRDGADQLIAQYEYDPFDLRLVKTLYRDDTGQTLTTPERIHYLYSDEGLIAEPNTQGQVTT